LYLQSNHLSGTISRYLSNCTNLTEFDLSNNQLHGTVPKDFGSFPIIGELRKSFRWDDDCIVSQRLRNIIEVFDMEGNNLTGGAPDQLCQNYADVYKPFFHCGGCSCGAVHSDDNA
jgi:hypothetical protein